MATGGIPEPRRATASTRVAEAMRTDTPEGLGRRLREVRLQRGLSLSGVESASNGVWKASVVGSYERGDRTITVPRLIALAEFYGIPVWRLFPGSDAAADAATPDRVTIDLVALGSLPLSVGGRLSRYLASISEQRGDYNGRVITVRGDDLQALAAVYGESPVSLLSRLRAWGVVVGSPVAPD